MSAVHAGTSGWAYPSWKPRFYPAKLPAAKVLGYYATRLNTVEVNYTYRTFPTEKLLAGWIAATPQNFRFAVKAHQSITHIKRLKGTREIVDKFVKAIEPLREAGRLAPILFQLPPNFKCDLDRLKDFLEGLPPSTRSTIEFRQESWFCEEVFALLRSANVALCFAESDDLDTPHVETADFYYLRLRKEKYTPKARKDIAVRVAKLARKGETFTYYKHEDEPDGALYAEELLAATGREGRESQ
jgi:uncharacterized protein YecE (DUF72 family)